MGKAFAYARHLGKLLYVQGIHYKPRMGIGKVTQLSRLLKESSLMDEKTVTRRQFLSVAAGAATSGLPPRHTLAAAKITRFGFTTYQWGQDWDIATLIAHCSQAKVGGVELRTSQKYAHGVELELSSEKRREAKRQFEDSPVQLVGMACGEKYDALDPAAVKLAIENSKGFLKLSHDVGSTGLRVFPNDFHQEVPREKTIEQIGKALREIGGFAADYGQEVRLEAHGSAGDLVTIRAIMDQVRHPAVRVKLNSSARDKEGKGFQAHFNLVKDLLADTLHLHELTDREFPYALQMSLLVQSGWTGWQLLEASAKVPDRLKALIEQREIWDRMLAQALQA